MARRLHQPTSVPAELHWSSVPPMLFPSEYLYLVAVSTLDVMLTWIILQMGGSEVNPVASMVIAMWGLPGAIAFKFGLTLFVILMCEFIGRRRRQTALWLIRAGVLISATAPAYSLLLLLMHAVFYG